MYKPLSIFWKHYPVSNALSIIQSNIQYAKHHPLFKAFSSIIQQFFFFDLQVLSNNVQLNKHSPNFPPKQNPLEAHYMYIIPFPLSGF